MVCEMTLLKIRAAFSYWLNNVETHLELEGLKCQSGPMGLCVWVCVAGVLPEKMKLSVDRELELLCRTVSPPSCLCLGLLI